MAKNDKKESIGSKIMGGIKSIGSQIKSDFGEAMKPRDQQSKDYRQRTDDTIAVNRAIASGDPSGLRDDLQSRYKREELMNRMGGASDGSPSAAMTQPSVAMAEEEEMGPAMDSPAMRYNRMMRGVDPMSGGIAGLQQTGGKGNALTVQQPQVTPDMRRAALDVFESQRGAGQMPYYMAAAQGATSPAFQYAAQNYDVLGGSQRLAPRPMEMMSVAERQQINDMAQAMADQQAQQADYQRGMDMVMRGGGKGGPTTMPQSQPMMPTNMPPNFASMLTSRFGMLGGQ